MLSDELKRAEVQNIYYAHVTEFTHEWKVLSREKPLPPSSKLLGLQPKLDDDGLMRSDGRLKHVEFLAYDVRYPIILPRRNWVTKLFVKEYHEPGPTRHLQHCPLDTGYLQDVKKYKIGKKNVQCVADGNQSLARK